MDNRNLQDHIVPSAQPEIISQEITGQLLQIAPGMEHIDDLLLWVSHKIILQFNLQTVEFWTVQQSRKGERVIQPRAILHYDTSILEHVLVNDHIVGVIQYVLQQQKHLLPHPVEQIFAPYQATVLKRHGLHFCLAFYLTGPLIIPPLKPHQDQQMPELAFEKIPTPLQGCVIIFASQKPEQNILLELQLLLDRLLVVASQYGLLLPLVQREQQLRLPGQVPNSPPPLKPPTSSLIPVRCEDDELLATKSPLASSHLVISGKGLRRIYSLIDGEKDITRLLNETKLEPKDLYPAIQTLMELKHIELRTPQGEKVDRLSDHTVR